MASEAVVTDARDGPTGASARVAPTGLFPRPDPPAVPTPATGPTPSPAGLAPACDFIGRVSAGARTAAGGMGACAVGPAETAKATDHEVRV